jgi:2-amino-4-hydroxy-6-hydroxymethyldihydropteridine diphosphokinase
MGSNINPAKNIPEAIELISDKLEIIRISKYYISKPVAARGDDFINVGLLVNSDIKPRNLKYDVLRPIEKQLGRHRNGDTMAPRCIDLDIIFCDCEIWAEEDLSIPDPDFLKYPHVALPIGELSDDFVHPILNEKIKKLSEKFIPEIGKSIHIVSSPDN